MKLHYFIHLTRESADTVATGISLRAKPSASINCERVGELHHLLTHARMLALENLRLLRVLAVAAPEELPEGSFALAALAWLELASDFLATEELRSLQEETSDTIAALHVELLLSRLRPGKPDDAASKEAPDAN